MQCEQITKLLADSIQRNRTDSLLLSGGLDSSIIASIAKPEYCVTVAFGFSAPDIEYSRSIAQRYSRRHMIRTLDERSTLEIAEQVIKILGTFDPMAIRNSIVAYAGIEQARKDGYSEVMSGDGCDELFAGYNFLAKYYTDVGKLNAEMERLWRIMHFSSFDLAQALSARIKAPFLDSEFAAYAKTIPITAKIGIHEQRQWGKYILRTCFEASLGRIIAWREKAAQELGAGIQGISAILDESVKDSTFQQIAEQAAAEKVLVRNKEHAQYYLFYRKYYAPPIEQEEQLLSEKECSNRCPQCMGCFKSEGRFCRICGAYPVIPIPMSSSSSSPKSLY